MTPVLASVPVDITVPDTAPPVNGAELTLSWNTELLGGFDPTLARIYTFDTDAGMWLPVPGDQAVDVAAGTVTAHLEHFSVYAILKIAQPSDWAQVFTQLPVRCVAGPGGGGVDLDVAFVIDQSGSMNTYDPQDRRVEAARAFLDEMSDDDRATVIGFNSAAIDRAPLLRVGDNRTTLQNAITATGSASGGTAFTPPMTLAINRLAAVASQDRLRVIVMLTDGQGSYNTALTAQAANAGIEIYTVGLGNGVNANLLTAMAEGTGGTYQALASADDLPALYRELAQDLTDNRADDDHDLIPDCVERNGAFVPQRNIDYGTGTAFTLAPSFITTTEPDDDSDDDDLIDGAELSARSFADNPYLADEYSYLVDQGLEEYYKFYSDPNDPDTDGDGIDDATETTNGLDPTTYTIGVETDIESLDYPPFTLFRSAIADELDPFQRMNFDRDSQGRVTITKVVYTQTPVEFQIDGDCVSNCQPLIDRAAEWGNGNGNGICFAGIGDCVDDNDQIRTLMRQAIRAQGIFTDDGKQLTEQYVRDQSLLLCLLWSGDLAGCSDNLETLDVRSIDIDDGYSYINNVAVVAVPVAAPGAAAPPINPAWVAAVAAAAVAVGTVVAVPNTYQVTEDDVAAIVAACAAQTALLRELVPNAANRHPCEILAMYFPGQDIGAALDTRVNAIAANPSRILQRYSSAAETETRKGIRQGWAAGQPGCTGVDRTAAQATYGTTSLRCDEFPNFSMQDAGPGAYLKYVPSTDNTREGARYGTFVNAPVCTQRVKLPAYDDREQFAVVPVGLPITFFTCGLRLG